MNPYARAPTKHSLAHPHPLSNSSNSSNNNHLTPATFHNCKEGDGSPSISSTLPDSAEQQFRCLYTKHKTQKRKVWHDGRLVVVVVAAGTRGGGGRAKLFPAQPRPGVDDPILDECDLTREAAVAVSSSSSSSSFSSLEQLETEQFLIQIEGPWKGSPQSLLGTHPSKTTTTTTTTTPTPPSRGMQKLLGTKFQKPRQYIPLPPHQRQPPKLQQVLGHRKRPLQPGEWEQMHSHSSTTTRMQQPQQQQQEQAPPTMFHRYPMVPSSSGHDSQRFQASSRSHPQQLPGNDAVAYPTYEPQHLTERPVPHQTGLSHQYDNDDSGRGAFRWDEQEQEQQQRLLLIPQVQQECLAPPPPLTENYHSRLRTNMLLLPPSPPGRQPGDRDQQQQQAAQGTQSQRPGSMGFVSNEFSEDGYYGIEEEEEVEDDEQANFAVPVETNPSYERNRIEQQPSLFSLGEKSTLGNGGGQGNIETNHQDAPLGFVLDETPLPPHVPPTTLATPESLGLSSAAAQQRPIRSTHEVMSLFGAFLLPDKENTQKPVSTAAVSTPVSKPVDTSQMQFQLTSPTSSAYSSDAEDPK